MKKRNIFPLPQPVNLLLKEMRKQRHPAYTGTIHMLKSATLTQDFLHNGKKV